MNRKLRFFTNLLLIVFLGFLTLCLQGQSFNADIRLIRDNLGFLSDHDRMGRYPATEQDSISAYYIGKKLLKAGFEPLIGNHPVIPFYINLYREVKEGSYLKVNGRDLAKERDYLILPNSQTAYTKGLVKIINSDSLIRGDYTKDSLNSVAFIYGNTDSLMYYTTPLIELGYKALLFSDSSRTDFGRVISFRAGPISLVNISDSLAREISASECTGVEINSFVEPVRGRTYNVLAVTPGSYDKYILVGAHYDHLGVNADGDVFYGADDNASGVAAALETGRLLIKHIETAGQYGVAIAAFGAEERGLLGSRFLADTLNSLGKLPLLMINFDMVGRMNDMKLQVGGIGTFQGADSIVKLANKRFNYELSLRESGFGPSDHASFSAKEVPVLYFTTGVHREYHTPGDILDLINFEGIAGISEMTSSIIMGMAESKFVPEYKPTESQTAPARSSFSVTLGIIPDFTYEKGDGFMIGPVSDGRPAHKAGLKEGDIIIRIGDKKINSIYDYMSVLGDYKRGDKTEVEFFREEVKITVEVEF